MCISHHNDNGHVALYDYVFGPHHATLTLLPIDDDGLTLMQLRHYRRGDTLSVCLITVVLLSIHTATGCAPPVLCFVALPATM